MGWRIGSYMSVEPAVFRRRDIIGLLKYLVEMCSVGESQRIPNVRNVLSCILEPSCGLLHAERHAEVEQSQPGVFLGDGIEVGAGVAQEL